MKKLPLLEQGCEQQLPTISQRKRPRGDRFDHGQVRQPRLQQELSVLGFKTPQ